MEEGAMRECPPRCTDPAPAELWVVPVLFSICALSEAHPSPQLHIPQRFPIASMFVSTQSLHHPTKLLATLQFSAIVWCL